MFISLFSPLGVALPVRAYVAPLVRAFCAGYKAHVDMDSVEPPVLRGIRTRLDDARVAASEGTLSPTHYRKMDEAISNALQRLPSRRCDDTKNDATRFRWADPEPIKVLALDSEADDGSVERLRALFEQHVGPLQDLVLQPQTRAELAAIFPGINDDELHRVLTDMQQVSEVSSSQKVNAKGAASL